MNVIMTFVLKFHSKLERFISKCNEAGHMCIYVDLKNIKTYKTT